MVTKTIITTVRRNCSADQNRLMKNPPEGCGECVRYRCPYLDVLGFCRLHCSKARLVFDCPELELAKSRAASRWKSAVGGMRIAYP